MKININYPQLAAEFVIVFVGVAVALAADSWREDLQERNSESNYIEALRMDLARGLQQLEGGHELARSIFESTTILISELESRDNEIEDSNLVNHFILASRLGYNPATLRHDSTYGELLSTGRLNLIRDGSIRSALSDYYRQVSDIDLIREDHPRFMLDRFYAMVGKIPYRPLDTWRDLSEDENNRIIREFRDNPKMIEELRILRARHELLTEPSRPGARYGVTIELNKRLQSMLQ